MTSSVSTPPPESSPHEPIPRRGFFISFLTNVIGMAITLTPIVIGSIFFVDPLLRKRKETGAGEESAAPEEGYVKVARLDSLPTDETPVNFRVKMDIRDAWNLHRDQPVGAVYLSRDAENKLRCFNQICPHLGCDVSFRPDSRSFICPCHDSSFALDGTRNNQIPPRDLDPLDTIVTETGDIWVKYVKFSPATSERKVIQ